jgi:hypothetical protein
MKKQFKICILVWILFLINIIPLLSQTRIYGIVKEAETELPLEYVTIALYSSDSTLLSGVITSIDGHFSFNDIKDGEYYLSVSLIGYQELKHSITILSDKEIILSLKKADILLNEVIVRAERQPVTYQDGRFIINVEAYTATEGKTATDIIKFLPGVISNGNSLSILGKEVTVFIDGRPSRMSGNELNQYLTTLHGNQIDKIEIITNPSSKYDASYNGAIVDIKLKRDISLGFNGSFSSIFGIKESGLVIMPGININYRTKKFNLYGNYNLNNGKYKQTIDYNRKYHDLDIPLQYDEHGIYRPKGTFNNLRTGLDYFVSNNHILGFLLSGGIYNGGNNNSTTTNIHNIGNDRIDSTIISPLKMNIDSKNLSVNLNHNWKVNEKGTLLNSDFNYSYFDTEQNQSILSDFSNNIVPRKQKGDKHFIDQRTNLWSAKLDLTQPVFNNNKIEIGIKYDHINRHNNILSEYLTENNWIENIDASNYFKYKEHIIALYFNASKKINQLSFDFGLRYERTIEKGDQITIDSVFTKNKSGFYPSLSINYSISDNSIFSISYSKKIERPSFNMLNPFKFYTTPYTYQVGNPNLEASNYHSLDVSYNYEQLSFYLMYSKQNNMFIQEPFLNEQTKELIYTYNNFGKNEGYGFNSYTPVKVSKWWKTSINLGIYYTQLKSIYAGSLYNKNYWDANISVTNSFSITESTKIGLNARYSTPTWNIASRIKPRGYMDISFVKSLWNGRGNISFLIIDPFRWDTFISNLKYKNIDEKTKNIPDMRMLRVSFQYKFGSSKVERNRRRNTGTEELENRIR